MTHPDDLDPDADEIAEALKELQDEFHIESDAYADISMTIAYLKDPDYYLG